MAHQKSSQKFWVDAAGEKIPYNRITKVERLKEKEAASIAKQATKLNHDLGALKDYITNVCNSIYKEVVKSNIERKGNFTWFNFDRSIKIETAINETISFDDLLITSAREKLDDFLTNSIDGKVDFVKELVLNAFKTSKGKLDPKKVMGLLTYRAKINNKLYQEACTDIENAMHRVFSKVYHRVFIMDSNGEYKAIDLNFSSI